MKRIVLFLVALLFCFKAEASQIIMVYGWGSESCGARTKMQANRPLLNPSGMNIPFGGEGQEQWVLGFISAYNVYQSTTPVMTGGDTNGLFGWIDDYCAAHPLDSILKATMALVVERSQ